MQHRLRFAPSPTGYVHIGGLRTALYNYLFAKKNNGTYLLRIEDTDQSRLVEGAIEGMIKAMAWAGVEHEEGPFIESSTHEVVQRGDFGPYVQSQRLDIYQKYAEQLLNQGDAYRCFCSKERLEELRENQRAAGETPKYDGACQLLTAEEVEKKIESGEPHVVRLKLPKNRVITFNDLIKGEVSVNTNDMDDQVLVKTDGFPTYHLAVVVDDYHMKISHVVRGDEWLISTPKHIYLYEVLGWEAPQFVHLPVILGKTKKKLSKREGDVAVEDFRRKGYLPEALINYIALVGWSPEGDQEILSMKELIEQFSFERVSKSSGVFDVDKLNWINNHYIKNYDLQKLTMLCKSFLIEAGFVTEADFESRLEWLEKIVGMLRERLDKLEDLADHLDLFVKHDIEVKDEEALEVIKADAVPELLKVLKEHLSSFEEITAADVKATLKKIQKETGIKGKQLFMPVRVAVTGQVHGPDIAELIEIIGVSDTLKRIEHVNQHYVI